MNLIKNVATFIRQNNLIEPADKIIVGVSGGADSVSLLYILYNLRHEFGIKLHVAHFNHNLRSSALEDQRFVAHLAKSLNLHFHARKWTKNRNLRGSKEELAREARFKFLIDLSQDLKADAVALAHTQNDLAETVLMRILRGSGLQGLRAILPAREIHHTKIIRPLLDVSRDDIMLYIKEKRLKYREDPTNQQKVFFRNQIRLDLLPFLKKKYNPNVIATLSCLAKSVAWDFDYIDQKARVLFKDMAMTKKQEVVLNLSKLKKQPMAMRHMLLRLAIEALKNDTNQITLEHIREIDDLLESRPINSIVHLPQHLQCSKKKGVLTIKTS